MNTIPKSTPRTASVVPHPAGGFTIARPTGNGSVRIYEGNYTTRRAAEAKLYLPIKHAA